MDTTSTVLKALTATLVEAITVIVVSNTGFAGLAQPLIPDPRLLAAYIILTTTYNIILVYLLESYILGLAGAALTLYYSGGLSPQYYLVSVIAAAIIAWRLGLSETLLATPLVHEWEAGRLENILHSYTVYTASLSLGFMLAYILVEELRPAPTVWYQWIILGLIAGLLLPLKTGDKQVHVATGLLTPLSYISIAPISYIALTALSQPHMAGITRSKTGVLMGFVKAILVEKRGGRRGGSKWYWKKTGEIPFRVDFTRLPNNHVVITGASGMGKSLLAKNMVLQLYSIHGYGFLIIDPHGEYGDLAEIIPGVNIIDASNISLNPLELEGQEPGYRAHQLSYTIQSLFNLGHLQRQVIEDLILETYRVKGIYPENPETWGDKPPNFNDLLATATAVGKDDELARKVIPYLRILSSRVFSSTSMGFREIISRPSIIQLNKLSSDYIRSLYIDTLLHKIIASMYKRRRGRQIIVIDEAHLVFRRSPGKHAVSKLLMESRKYGLGFIIIAQQPLSLPDTVYQNTSIRISFNTGEPRNAEYAARLHASSGDKSKVNKVKEAVSSLKPHEYVLSGVNLRGPLIIDSSSLRNLLAEAMENAGSVSVARSPGFPRKTVSR